MPIKTLSHDQFIASRLQKDRAFLEAYLNEALNAKDGRVSHIMFHRVAKALGGITQLAKRSGLNRQNLYRAFSGKRDPSFSTVEQIIHAFGFRLKVERIKS